MSGDNIDLSVFSYREKPIDPELPDGRKRNQIISRVRKFRNCSAAFYRRTRKVETPAIIDMKCELSQLIDAMSGQKLNDLTNNGTVQHTNKGVMEQVEHIKKADKIYIARTEDLDVNATKILKVTTTQISTTEDNLNKQPLKELGDTEKKEVTELKQKQPPVSKKTKRELRKERGVPGRNQQSILSNSQGPKADTPKKRKRLTVSFSQDVDDKNTEDVLHIVKKKRLAVSFNKDVDDKNTEDGLHRVKRKRLTVSFDKEVDDKNKDEILQTVKRKRLPVSFCKEVDDKNTENVLHTVKRKIRKLSTEGASSKRMKMRKQESIDKKVEPKLTNEVDMLVETFRKLRITGD